MGAVDMWKRYVGFGIDALAIIVVAWVCSDLAEAAVDGPIWKVIVSASTMWALLTVMFEIVRPRWYRALGEQGE
jgi:hypothetical protein